MKKGFKTRIYPDKQQAERLSYYCRIAHDMQNFIVGKYKEVLPPVNSFGIIGVSPSSLMEEFGVDIPQRIVLGVLKTYAYSVQTFWDKRGNKPKFHKYNPNKQSFYIASDFRMIKKNSIAMPLLKWENTDISKRIPIDMQIINKYNITKVIEPRFTEYKGKWYLSGTYIVEDVQKQTNCEYIGLDWGIKNFMTTSNGDFINYPKTVTREFQRINKLQHYRDKKIIGSNNYKKISLKIDKAYNRLENLKRDFIEQTTTNLSKHNNIVVEDLSKSKIKRNQKFIRRINTISPHNRFIEKLQWKTQKFGTNFQKVNPAYTSMTCSCCGEMNFGLKLSDRVFKCECGNVMDRDVNAARNLVAMAICCSQ